MTTSAQQIASAIDRAFLSVRLVHKDGDETVPWTWYVIARSGSSEPSRLELKWTVDGVEKSATHPGMPSSLEAWDVGAGIDADVSAEDLDAHVSGISLTWEDRDGAIRWRQDVTLGTNINTGAFLLPLRRHTGQEGFAISRWPEPVESNPVPT